MNTVLQFTTYLTKPFL